jgi:hypothetical protein
LVDEQVDLAMTLFGFGDPNGQLVWWECVIEGRQWQRLRQWILCDLELVDELCEERREAERPLKRWEGRVMDGVGSLSIDWEWPGEIAEISNEKIGEWTRAPVV